MKISSFHKQKSFATIACRYWLLVAEMQHIHVRLDIQRGKKLIWKQLSNQHCLSLGESAQCC